MQIIREILTEDVRMHGLFWYHPPVGVDFRDKFRSGRASLQFSMRTYERFKQSANLEESQKLEARSRRTLVISVYSYPEGLPIWVKVCRLVAFFSRQNMAEFVFAFRLIELRIRLLVRFDPSRVFISSSIRWMVA